MFMRTFLLVLIAVMAATSVSCQDVPISAACNTSSVALDNNPDVNLGESYIIKTGCTKLNFNDDYIKNNCAEVGEQGFHRCGCETTLGNTSFWVSAVNMSSGRTCYIDLTIVLTGTEMINNQTRPTEVTHIHYNFGFVAVPNACNKTDIEGALLVPFANEGVGFVDSSLNANSNVSGVTWTSGSVTVSACDASRTVSKVIPSSNTGGTTTTTPPTTTPSGTASNSTNSTSSPTTTVPPVTPTPTNISSSSSSSSSSTGGKGTGTSTGNGNGASSSVMVHSATAVMVALISAAVGVAVITTA